MPDLEFALDPITPPDVTAAPAPAEEEPFDLAFDMSFGDPQSESPAPAAAPVDMAGLAAEFDLPEVREATPALASSDALSLYKDPLFDLDSMDFGLPPSPVQPAAVAEATPFHGDVPTILAMPVPAAAPSGNMDDPLFDLDTMDFGSPAEPAPAAVARPVVETFDFDPPPAPAAAPVEESFSFDLADDPFALPETPAAAPAAQATPSPGVPVEPSFDMTDIDLDLPDFDRVEAAPAPALPDVGEALEPAAMSPEHMEMETKLDLAIAYQEIGDKEGARELLDEVIKGGSSEQVSKASAMRSLLA